jgi:hypothetical protein
VAAEPTVLQTVTLIAEQAAQQEAEARAFAAAQADRKRQKDAALAASAPA